ncbi:MAG: hypothetical protein CVV64_00320 [Candidatus Wallbacteria bacterium HGW-Wallbacteria-1]|jgi:two-component system chemotaxis response regulator CheY|uniref:Response regulatory domain-containing protein n=1 Tax=Candidatus Wallbacteria bacterium HGW-Wallbacteria-1 TaxID=2013854 RepID=A0A2N1PU85_9BACT|nr:MAG: hypothetical protein CVV64_00320 [Candidatus Wallbacteria bacterium HGW-Wallbacteria-1]
MEKRVLIADDAMFMRFALKNIIDGDIFKVVDEASDGAEAVDKFRDIKPDLTILDLNMPNVSGLEALKQIMNLDSKAKVIVACCSGEMNLVVEALKSGAADYIVKPVRNAEETIDMMNRVLG